MYSPFNCVYFVVLLLVELITDVVSVLSSSDGDDHIVFKYKKKSILVSKIGYYSYHY